MKVETLQSPRLSESGFQNPSRTPPGTSPTQWRLQEKPSRSATPLAPNPPPARLKHRIRAEMGGRSPRPCKASRTAGGDGIRTSGAPDNSHGLVAAQVCTTDDADPRTERQEALASGHKGGSMPATADLEEVGRGCARCSDPSRLVARASLSRLERPADLVTELYSPLWSPSVNALQMHPRRPRIKDGFGYEVTAEWPERSLYTPATTS